LSGVARVEKCSFNFRCLYKFQQCRVGLAGQVQEASGQLVRRGDALNAEVDRFLSEVRAA